MEDRAGGPSSLVSGGDNEQAKIQMSRGNEIGYMSIWVLCTVAVTSDSYVATWVPHGDCAAGMDWVFFTANDLC